MFSECLDVPDTFRISFWRPWLLAVAILAVPALIVAGGFAMSGQLAAAAAVDPSHIPGLTAPVSVKKEKQEEPEDIKPTESAEPAETEEPSAGGEAEAVSQARLLASRNRSERSPAPAGLLFCASSGKVTR